MDVEEEAFAGQALERAELYGGMEPGGRAALGEGGERFTLGRLAQLAVDDLPVAAHHAPEGIPVRPGREPGEVVLEGLGRRGEDSGEGDGEGGEADGHVLHPDAGAS